VEGREIKTRHWLAVGGIALAFGVGALTRWPVGPLSWVAPSDFDRDVAPVLEAHCFDCHGGGASKGDIVLDEFASAEERQKVRSLWEGVYHNVEAGLMPPPGEPPLSDSQKAKLAEWIEREVFRLDPHHPDPGKVVIRRLNRQEYRNSIRELFGEIPVDPSANLPPDDSGYGFDNVGAVLSMSPELLEKYVLAADRVLGVVIRTRPPAPDLVAFEAETDFRGVQHASHGTGSLARSGVVGVKLPVKRNGEYQIRIWAGADQAGDELAKMGIKIGAAAKETFEIEAEPSRPKPVELSAKLNRGEQWLEMAFLNDYYDPNARDSTRRDRNLHIQRVELVGPVDLAPPPPSAAHQAIFSPGGDGSDRQRAERILAVFGRRAWRRALSSEEVARLMALFEMARGQGDSFEGGVALAIQAVLVSPRFLFRGEGIEVGPREVGIVPISELELASRLSFFLWSGPPDEHLLGLAEGGRLREQLHAEVVRMLEDRRAQALVENFAGQWLQLRNLDLVVPDRKSFPAWNDRLREAMRGETEELFQSIFTGDRSLLEFLDGNYTFLNESLARHYGIDGVKGESFRRVSLQGQVRRQRGGVLGHASVLTLTSHPTRTSPVNRGNWVLENLLGAPPPPPPPNVPLLEASAPRAVNGTLRARLEAHREKAACANCHARMDPIGLAMENYDGIGAWRETDGGQRIDPSGELIGSGRFESMEELRVLLLERHKEAFVRSLASSLLSYALGRGIEYFDKPALSRIQERVHRDGYRAHELVFAIVDSVPFQYRRALLSGGEQGP
jgi:mono/diheme cytochrome c family protein